MDSFSVSNSISMKTAFESDEMTAAYLEELGTRETDAISNERIRKGDRILETYRVVSDAITGGMGSVWRVHHTGWDTDLAMKRPQPKFFAEGGRARKKQFVDIGGTSNHLLVCVWASWLGEKGLEARDTLNYFRLKYGDRYFNVADISIDVNTDLWKSTIQGDTVSWISYSDQSGWESRMVKSANIRTLPVYMIFSSAKRLVFKTTSLEDLDIELDKTLPKPRNNQPRK